MKVQIKLRSYKLNQPLQQLWVKLGATIGFSIVTSLGVLPVFPVQADTTWQIGGQPTLIFAYPDAQSNTRIDQLNRRLAEIVANLNPSQVWTVDTFPSLPKPPAKALTPSPTLRSVTIRVQGQPLLEVTEADTKAHNAASVNELASTWVKALSYALNQPAVKQSLVGTIGMPSQIVYKGKTYYITSTAVGDRGWFRTDGQRVAGKAIFWEVSPEKRLNTANNPNRVFIAPESPSQIYILNRYMQFVPYSKL
jgi:hypothetical protein